MFPDGVRTPDLSNGHHSTLFRVRPQQQRLRVELFAVQFGVFPGVVDQVTDLAVDQLLNLIDQANEVGFVDIANQNQVDDVAVAPTCKIACKVHFLHIAQSRYHILDNFVDPDMLQQDVVQLAEERVRSVRLENFFVAVHMRYQHTGLFQAVQLHADGIARLAEFRLQAAQIRFGAAVEEKFQQQLDTGLGRNERLNHDCNTR